MFPDITQGSIILTATIVVYIIWKGQKNNDLFWLILTGIISALGSFVIYLATVYFIFLLKHGDYTAMVIINNYDMPDIYAIASIIAGSPLIIFILLILIIKIFSIIKARKIK